MATFEIEQLPELPDYLYIELDKRFNIAIERKETGLELRIYPRTDGELWDAPYRVYVVEESEIIELEKEFAE